MIEIFLNLFLDVLKRNINSKNRFIKLLLLDYLLIFKKNVMNIIASVDYHRS